MPLQFPPIFRLALDASPKSRVRRRALRPGVDGLERREALSTTVAGIVAMGTPGAAKGAVETRLLVGTEVPKSFGTQGLLVLAGPAQRVDPAAQWEADIQALEQFLQDQEVPILVVESWPITGH